MKKLLIIMIVALGAISLQAQALTIKVVVNNDNPISAMSKKEVSNMFLKKTSKWDNGQKVMAIDLVDTSAIRQEFSKKIHGRKVSSIKAFWQKQIFSGRNVPPAEKKSQREVLEFVQNNPGAIGYIASTTRTGNFKVKVVNIN